MQKLLTFFRKNISVYAIFNDQSFNDTLINDIISFEQLSPDSYFSCFSPKHLLIRESVPLLKVYPWYLICLNEC